VNEEDLEEKILALVNGLNEDDRLKAMKGREWFEENARRFQETLVSELRTLCATG